MTKIKVSGPDKRSSLLRSIATVKGFIIHASNSKILSSSFALVANVFKIYDAYSKNFLRTSYDYLSVRMHVFIPINWS
jgi:hypothetical protein